MHSYTQYYLIAKTRGGNWFNWNNKYRRVPGKYNFPMTINLSEPWHLFFVSQQIRLDHFDTWLELI